MSSSKVRGDQVRVLFLNTRDSFGADVAVHLALMQSLDRRWCDVSAATGTFEAEGGPSVRSRLESVPDLALSTLNLGRPMSGMSAAGRAKAAMVNAGAVANLARLAAHCRRKHIDVIHVTDRPRDVIFGWCVARLARCKLLVQAHTNFYEPAGKSVRDACLRRADAVVGVSAFTATTYSRENGFDPTKVHSVLNAVDRNMVSSMADLDARRGMRAALMLDESDWVVGCVARLMRWKGQPLLIEAFAELHRTIPQARLVIVGSNKDVSPDGDGDFEDYLRRRVTTLGIGDVVRFAGFVAPEEMPALYDSLAVLAHPAVDEPFGLVIVEAMARGVPVVAIRAGGVPEIIHDDVDGLLVTPDSVTELADALKRVFSESGLSERLSAAGRSRVNEGFTAQRQADEFAFLYRTMLTPAARGEASFGPAQVDLPTKGGH